MNQSSDKPVEWHQNKNHIKYLSLFILLISFAGLTSFLNLKGYSQDLRSQAALSDDEMYCPNQPSCCNDIIKQLNEKGDITDLPDGEQPYHACEGLYSGHNERGYCRHEICDQLPAGVKYRGRCGWYWSFHDGSTNTPNGYGCMIGDSEATMRPKYSASGATITPIPSVPPTAPPTAVPPTIAPSNTPPPVIQPTATAFPTQPLTIPTLTPTVFIPPSNAPSPALPTDSGSTPTNYIAPTSINLQPTTYNQQPSTTPTPTREPIIPKIGKRVNDIWGKIKINLQSFLSTILP